MAVKPASRASCAHAPLPIIEVSPYSELCNLFMTPNWVQILDFEIPPYIMLNKALIQVAFIWSLVALEHHEEPGEPIAKPVWYSTVSFFIILHSAA